MQAFLNDPELKAGLLIEIGKHEAADAIVRGRYGEMGLPTSQFKGCAIGCALHSLNELNGRFCPTPKSVSDHSRFPTELGIPIELAYHIDTVFENLPQREAIAWPRQVIEAITPGTDLSNVVPTLLQWVILDPKEGFVALVDIKYHETYKQFATLVARDWANSGIVTYAEWDSIDEALADDPIWAGAWARAGAGARAWVRAGAGAWVRAGAGARAWVRARAGAGAITALSVETLRLIREAK